MDAGAWFGKLKLLRNENDSIRSQSCAAMDAIRGKTPDAMFDLTLAHASSRHAKCIMADRV